MQSIPSQAAPPNIFISYRRAESAVHAGRLSDQLAAHFGSQVIFIDIDSIAPGRDFVKVIEGAVSSCKIMLAVIGQHWLTCANEQGRRLDNPKDFVRLEIAVALQRGIRVIPVLVQGATMPGEQELPDEIASLALRNAWFVRDVGWKEDVRKLIEMIEDDIPPLRADKEFRKGAEGTAFEKGYSQAKSKRYASFVAIVLGIAISISLPALRQEFSDQSDSAITELSPSSTASLQSKTTPTPIPGTSPTPLPTRKAPVPPPQGVTPTPRPRRNSKAQSESAPKKDGEIEAINRLASEEPKPGVIALRSDGEIEAINRLASEEPKL
jgi:hypothetical protein